MFDFSYSDSHQELYDEINKYFLGKFKPETPNSLGVNKNAALRAKAPALTCDGTEDNKRKTKGITRATSKQ